MLRNISNFFNIIRNGRTKTTLDPTDMIAVGTRNVINRSEYQDTAISFADLEAQVAVAGAQGPPGALGPAGAQGAQGIQGAAGPIGPAGLTWQGIWSAATVYAANDAVSFGGASYFAINAVGPDPNDPTVDTVNWALLASQGADGPQGPTGGGFMIQSAGRVTSVPAGGAQFEFRSFLIPGGTFSTGDIFNVISGFIAVTGTTGNFIYETYINTIPGLGGATNLFDITMNNSRRYMNTIQTFYIDDSGTGFTTGPAATLGSITSGFTQYNTSASDFTIDWTVDQYIIIAGRNDSDRDVINIGAKIF